MSVHRRNTFQRGRGIQRGVPDTIHVPSFTSRRQPNESRGAQGAASQPEEVSSQTSHASFFEASENVDIQGGSFSAGNQHINVTINASHPRAESQAVSESRNFPLLPVLSYPQIDYNTRDPLPIQRSCDIYYRHMSVKGRGSPLWIPQANNQLPVEYRRKGIEIGDVGILTASGSFDFLFNIFLPADHPLQPEVLPQGFIPSKPFRTIDIHIQEEFDENSYLASSSIQRAQHDSDLIGLSFKSSESEGAILTMPHGLNSKELSNMALARQYMQDHIENIYCYVNGNLGREVENGDVRLVIGRDKTTAWGMATFVRSTSQQELRLKFKPMTRGSLGRTYGWEYSGMAEVRSGPGTREVEQLRIHPDSNPFEHENQCLFMRTLNGTLGAEVWNKLEASKFCILDMNESSDSGHDASRDSANPNASQSTNDSRKYKNNADSNTSTLSQSKKTSVQTSKIDAAQALHPSRNINEYLLGQNPNAKVAITVDNDWISVINKDDSVLPPADIMLERILVSHEIKGGDDVVYLLPKYSIVSEGTLGHIVSPFNAGSTPTIAIHSKDGTGPGHSPSTSKPLPTLESHPHSDRNYHDPPPPTYYRKSSGIVKTLKAPSGGRSLTRSTGANSGRVSRRPQTSPTTGTTSHHSPSTPVSTERVIFVTADSERYVTVDLTGASTAPQIRKLILNKLHIFSDDESNPSLIYQTEIGSHSIGDPLTNDSLEVLCRDRGDSRGTLKFLVSRPTSDYIPPSTSTNTQRSHALHDPPRQPPPPTPSLTQQDRQLSELGANRSPNNRILVSWKGEESGSSSGRKASPASSEWSNRLGKSKKKSMDNLKLASSTSASRRNQPTPPPPTPLPQLPIWPAMREMSSDSPSSSFVQGKPKSYEPPSRSFRPLPETPKVSPFVYHPPPLPAIDGPVPQSQQLVSLPRNRFVDLASSSRSDNEASSSGNTRVQQYVSVAPLSTPRPPDRFGPAIMQEILASRSNAQEPEVESEDGSDDNSDVTSLMWQISPSRPLSLPTTVDSDSLFDLPFEGIQGSEKGASAAYQQFRSKFD